MTTDWRLPENRREMFQRSYSFHLKYRTHPGCVYFALPAISEAYDLDLEQQAWLVWLNGNTQNPAMSLLLLEAAPAPEWWRQAVDFWNDNFKLMDWDTDRRHQKSKFGEATERWIARYGLAAGQGWLIAGEQGWDATWNFAKSQPYMGRLSAWSMTEYARIMFGASNIPDAGSWMLEDKKGSQSHRNGLSLVKGYDSVYWEADAADTLGIVEELAEFGDELLAEARDRNSWGKEGDDGNLFLKVDPDVSRLTMESALCTYKSWHKPDRRYPNVYADMMYNRLKKAEARFGKRFEVLWQARRDALPEYLRLEDTPGDPGLTGVKQNWYREHGVPVMMHREYPDLANELNDSIDLGLAPARKEPTWS